MLSRRPKRRASSEKAPGPSKTSVADIAARFKAPTRTVSWFASVITKRRNARYEKGRYPANPPGSWKKSLCSRCLLGAQRRPQKEVSFFHRGLDPQDRVL